MIYRGAGVYEIRNTLNNHIYIGSSNDVYNRKYNHFTSLRKGTHYNQHLQRAWNKYGEQHFKFKILERCERVKDTLLYLEQKYLDLNPEYNILKKAYSCLGSTPSTATRKKQSKANKSKVPVQMLDKNTGKVLKEFESYTQAAIFLGSRNKYINISLAARGKRKSASGYTWKIKH